MEARRPMNESIRLRSPYALIYEQTETIKML